MGSAKAPSNKAKIARRVIEVLEFFDDSHREATVMDIVRRYNRPQSSTSELLSSLVELGLLHKDPYSRAYALTPRAGLLGVASQTGAVRDGRLVQLIDRLVAQTGLAVGIFALVGLNAQIVSWRAAARANSPATRGLYGGMQEPLYASAPGWLLLSTVAPQRADGLVRRLNAEAPDDRKFSTSAMSAKLAQCRELRYASGPAGFDSPAEAVALLLPEATSSQPLAVAFVYGAEARVKPEGLLECLREGVRHCLPAPAPAAAEVEPLPNAA
ncbi:MAG: helix-turn-helix domain-containing protein [Sphingomonadales bacterium]|nr:helix-turn-helix domain-containing protein [Sphingomonadales bacterium]